MERRERERDRETERERDLVFLAQGIWAGFLVQINSNIYYNVFSAEYFLCLSYGFKNKTQITHNVYDIGYLLHLR